MHTLRGVVLGLYIRNTRKKNRMPKEVPNFKSCLPSKKKKKIKPNNANELTKKENQL